MSRECYWCCLFVCLFVGVFVCLFVCLTDHSMERHTWVLIGPDLNKMLKPGYKNLHKHASPEWSMKIKKEKLIWSQEMKEKEDHSHFQQIKLNILASAFGTRGLIFFIQSQLPQRLQYIFVSQQWNHFGTHYMFCYLPSFWCSVKLPANVQKYAKGTIVDNIWIGRSQNLHYFYPCMELKLGVFVFFPLSK